MSQAAYTPAADVEQSHRFLPLLLILFVGSGCAALVYEIVWLQMLQLVIGSTAISLGVLLGTFMGGMCLGSLLLPRLISGKRHPLLVYACLEIGIAICGIAIVFGLPIVANMYTEAGGTPGVAVRAILAGICLLPPTLMMGATLPAVARWVETTPRGVSWLGFFYGGNIVGAVVGCLLAGFYLLRVHDMPTATFVAVAINVVVAGLAIALATAAPHVPPKETGSKERGAGARSPAAPGAWAVYLAIGLSGLCALGAEVVWTRILSLTFGGTVYTFSIILGVFLMGLGIGSSVGAMMARSVPSPRAALGVCQLLLCGAIAWSAFTTAESMPYWPIQPDLALTQWYTFQLDMARTVWAILPAACLWGASFPLALAAAAAPGQEPGRLVGGLYAVNTVGAIVGSLAFAIWLVPNLATADASQLGTQNAQRILIVLSFVAALAAFLPVGRRAAVTGDGAGSDTSSGGYIEPAQAAWWLGGAVVATCAVVFLVMNLPPIPWGLGAYGRNMATWKDSLAPNIHMIAEKDIPNTSGNPTEYPLFFGEGMNVTVVVSQSKGVGGDRSFHGGGKVQASNDPADMRLQRMLGHIPALVHKNPETVLVVACGAGVTAGSFIPHPEVKEIVIVDIEPLVPEHVAPLFKKENFNVCGPENRRSESNPDGRVTVQIDDGRHYIRTTEKMFDVITSDPIDPWVKGCAALNTKEYYEMCKAHLNEGGVMALWMPIYESNEASLKSVISTFFEVFDHGILWTNDVGGEGYDAVLFGQVGGTKIDLDELQERFMKDDHAPVRASMREVGFQSIYQLLGTFAGEAQRMERWREGAQINTDTNLRLQYLAGLALNNYLGKELLDDILKYYTFPNDIFQGSDEKIELLQMELSNNGRK